VRKPSAFIGNSVDGLCRTAEFSVLLKIRRRKNEGGSFLRRGKRHTLTGELPPGAEPRTVKIIAESLPFRLSLTRVMRPNRTNCAAISAASSLPTTDVKSQSHSRAVTAAKQYL
jgi:hypothetical protein